MARRKAIPKKVRFEVFKRDKFTCTYCGRKAPDVVLEVDHIIPVAKGGHPSDLSNLQLAHFPCNRQKSDKIKPGQDFSTGTELISNRLLPQTFDWKNI